jgi:hypothetical protein
MSALGYQESPAMNMSRGRRYNFCAIAWAVCAALAAIACGWFLRHTDPGVPMRLVYALIPVVPTGLYLFSVYKSLRALDELQRRIQFEAVTFAFAATLILSLTFGMLQKSGFFLPWAWDWEGIWGLMLGTWVVGQIMAARRYA